ncbi:hypothetical protein BC834DRAFT_104131 [Gloeopeniophorella convolvens]|nr:hypothetical protein BC834DRAFT_104131 [Gloeopeniophorella convolvens]
MHLPPLPPPLIFSYNSLRTVSPHHDGGPSFSIERAQQLHLALKESKPCVRYQPGPASGVPMETTCVALGSGPLERRPTEEPLPDQGNSAQQTSISSLNHDVLLGIFDWYFTQKREYSGAHATRTSALAFRTSIHVCRIWRHLILKFWKHFNLEIYCTQGTPVVDLLTHFPPLPINLEFRARHETLMTKDEEGILRAMEQSHRLRSVWVQAPDRTMQRVFAVTNEKFPLLEALYLAYTRPYGSNVNQPPASTMRLSQAGTRASRGARKWIRKKIKRKTFVFPSIHSAPRPDPLHPEKAVSLVKPPTLPHLPALTKLLLSDIPSAVLLPPELLVQLLSAMPLLGSLHIGYRFPGLHRDTGTATIPRCTSLPHLRRLWFKGACGYFDDLVSHIGVPSMEGLDVTFFNRLPLDPPNLGSPFLRLWQSLVAKDTQISIKFTGESVCVGQGGCYWELLSRQSDWQVASAGEFCQSLAPALLSVVELKHRSKSRYVPSGWQPDGSEPQDWCNLLRPFSNAKTLKVDRVLCRDVSQALMSNGAQASLDLLPELQTLELQVGDNDGAKAFGDFLEHGMPISTTQEIPQ